MRLTTTLLCFCVLCACTTEDREFDEDANSGGTSSESGGASGEGGASGTASSGGTRSDGGTSAGGVGGSASGGTTASGGSESSSGGSSAGTGGGTGGTDTVDNEAPTIVALAPENGWSGVEADTVLVIRFSEPMAKGLVQQAFQSADIPSAEVTFAWNGAGDELTITPNTALAYAEADDLPSDDSDGPVSLMAREYSYQITNVAEDLAGNALAPVQVSFKTLRQLKSRIDTDDALTSSLSDGAVFTSNDNCGDTRICVGDSTADEFVKTALTYDIAHLPFDAIIESATLKLSNPGTQGSPFSLGTLALMRVQNFSPVQDGEDSPIISVAVPELATASGNVTEDVTPLLIEEFADREARGQRVQLRLEFSSKDDDGVADYVQYYRTAPITVVYLLP